VELTEGTDTLKVVLEKVFADEDNDPLTFSVEMESPLLTVLDKVDKLTLADTIHLVTKSVKKDTTFLVAVNATDGKSTDVVKAHYKVTIVDAPATNMPPIAADIEYEVDEDDDLMVPINRGIKTFCSDPDGEEFYVIAPTEDSTKYGELSDVGNKGDFTYTPNKNFHGEDSFTYKLAKKTADGIVYSATGTVTIIVKPVNDAPVAKVSDSTFIKDTLVLDMDFDEDTVSQIKIPAKALTFTDVEVTEGTQKLSYGAKGVKKIKAELDSLNKSYYFISVKPEAGASGLATIKVYATDGTDTTGVNIYVKLVSPTDVAQAVADEYTAFKDSTLSVSAKEGVLANDKYPEGVTKGMTAKLAQKPTHGSLTLNKDGSFKYTPKEGFEGTDYFGYYCVINETESKVAKVTISVEKANSLPTVVVKPATLDTTVTEDFPSTKPIKFTKSTVASWFKDPEGDPLTYSAKSKDGKLKVEITDKGILEINSAPDSTGDAYVVVTATDKKSGSKSFEFCVTIKPVNDKPALVHADTAYVKKSGWTVKWDLDTLVVDVDGDELTFSPNETSALSKLVTISMKGSVITIKANSGVKFKDDQKINVGVKVSDPDKANVTIPLYIIVGEKPAGLMPQLAQPKNTWQNAVMAKRGTAKIMDMKGRVVWNAKLPVNPAEVLNASAKVQGRKILRVNTQTWTIK
jgi:VCBS repeat-containing protein